MSITIRQTYIKKDGSIPHHIFQYEIWKGDTWVAWDGDTCGNDLLTILETSDPSFRMFHKGKELRAGEVTQFKGDSARRPVIVFSRYKANYPDESLENILDLWEAPHTQDGLWVTFELLKSKMRLSKCAVLGLIFVGSIALGSVASYLKKKLVAEPPKSTYIYWEDYGDD